MVRSFWLPGDAQVMDVGTLGAVNTLADAALDLPHEAHDQLATMRSSLFTASRTPFSARIFSPSSRARLRIGAVAAKSRALANISAFGRRPSARRGATPAWRK